MSSAKDDCIIYKQSSKFTSPTCNQLLPFLGDVVNVGNLWYIILVLLCGLTFKFITLDLCNKVFIFIFSCCYCHS